MVSFGYKYGIPIDADLVLMYGFTKSALCATHAAADRLEFRSIFLCFKWSDTQKFNEKILDLLQFMLPQYKKEGKSQLVVGIGCTGGQHRSVAIAEYFSKQLSPNYITHVSHRDIDKRKGH